jgi:hypothetical protein
MIIPRPSVNSKTRISGETRVIPSWRVEPFESGSPDWGEVQPLAEIFSARSETGETIRPEPSGGHKVRGVARRFGAGAAIGYEIPVKMRLKFGDCRGHQRLLQRFVKRLERDTELETSANGDSQFK